MGQLALGLRSLLVKATIFFVMAAALAWALGGTLFPRPHRVELAGVDFAGQHWNVRLSVGGDRPGVARYELVSAVDGEKARPVGPEFAESTEIVIAGDELLVAMRRFPADGGRWLLRRVDGSGQERGEELGDRLAVEQALAESRAAAPF